MLTNMGLRNKQTSKWNTLHFTLCTAVPRTGCHTPTKRWWGKVRWPAMG